MRYAANGNCVQCHHERANRPADIARAEAFKAKRVAAQKLARAKRREQKRIDAACADAEDAAQHAREIDAILAAKGQPPRHSDEDKINPWE